MALHREVLSRLGRLEQVAVQREQPKKFNSLTGTLENDTLVTGFLRWYRGDSRYAALEWVHNTMEMCAELVDIHEERQEFYLVREVLDKLPGAALGAQCLAAYYQQKNDQNAFERFVSERRAADALTERCRGLVAA